MEPANLTIEILKSIRDEIRSTNVRLDSTNERLDSAVDRIERLERRQVEMETRLATQLIAVVEAVNEVRDLLQDNREIREKVAQHEVRITALEQQRSA